ncbi:MAG: type III secretion system chaperone [Succinivibrio sp.]|nr:type III secretion system chaperone [Succinivibrio sp.]
MITVETLNELIENRHLRLNRFDAETKFSQTELACGSFSLYLDDAQLRFMLSVLRLDAEFEQQVPGIYKLLLVFELLGGEYGNLRLCLDDDSGLLWICYNLSLERFETENFIEAVERFKTQAPLYREVVLEEIRRQYVQSSGEQLPESHPDAEVLDALRFLG